MLGKMPTFNTILLLVSCTCHLAPGTWYLTLKDGAGDHHCLPGKLHLTPSVFIYRKENTLQLPKLALVASINK